MSTSARTGTCLGIATGAPFVVWSLCRSGLDPAPALVEALRGLWLVQAMLLALSVPRAFGTRSGDRGTGLLAFLLVPLPLLVVAWQAGATPPSSLLRVFGLFGCWALCLMALAVLLERSLHDARIRSLGLGVFEVSLACMALASRDVWIDWTNP